MSGEEAVQQIDFRVPGMTCGHCVAAVAEELERVEGVSSVTVDLETKAVRVVGEGVDPTQLWAAVDEAGYTAET